MGPEVIGGLCILLFFVCIFIGVPVAFSLPIASSVGIFAIGGSKMAVSTAGSIFATYMADYNMAVIPAFVLMGTLADKSGLLNDVFDVIDRFVGRLPGGLAIGSVICNTIFAACSGSIISACTVVGKTAIPKMLEAGYPPSRAMGCVAVSGALASLIPPSIIICIYGLIVSQSIGKVLIAGIIPGLFSACMYCLYIVLSSRKIPRSKQKYTWREKISGVSEIWVAGVIVVLLIGSMFFGLATPAEAGAVGCFGVFVLCVICGKMSWDKLLGAIVACVRITGMVMFLVVSAAFFGRLLVVSGLSELIVNGLMGLEIGKYMVFAMVAVIWIALGMLIDAAGMMVISLPVVYPVLTNLGFDPIWLGIICVKFCDIALVSPPVGMAVFATQAVSGGLPLMEGFKGSAPFVAVDVCTIFLWIAFPGIILFLPSLM